MTIKTLVTENLTTDTVKFNNESPDEIRAVFAQLAELAISSLEPGFQVRANTDRWYPNAVVNVKIRRGHSKADMKKIAARQIDRLKNQLRSAKRHKGYNESYYNSLVASINAKIAKYEEALNA